MTSGSEEEPKLSLGDEVSIFNGEKQGTIVAIIDHFADELLEVTEETANQVCVVVVQYTDHHQCVEVHDLIAMEPVIQ